MARRYIGLEIGTRSVKMAQCENNRLLRLLAEPLPGHYIRDGRIVSVEGMAEFLKEMARKYRLKDKRVCMILPDTVTYTRTLMMPAMTTEQLKLNLPYEFHDFIRDRKERYLFDYAMMGFTYGENGKPSSMKLMAAAASGKVVEEYRQMLRMAGWKLETAAPAAFAYSNLIREYEKVKKLPEAGEYCFVDLGCSSTRLLFFKGDCLEARREIEIGLTQVIHAVEDSRHVDAHVARSYIKENYQNICGSVECREIYSMVGVEVKRTMEFYGYRYPESRLDTIYFCGGGSRISAFRETVAEFAGMKPEDAGVLVFGNYQMEEGLLSPATAGITFR